MSATSDFSISGLRFQLQTAETVAVTDDFLPFQDTGGQIDWTICLHTVELQPPLPLRELYRDHAFFVRREGSEELRCFLDGTYGEDPYAVTKCDPESCMVTIRYKQEDSWYFSDIRRCFSHACFEQMLAFRHRLLLHASLVDTPYGGILFSGPSGVGKSTQAALWETYERCEVINGDRPILYRSGSSWLASGSPYAGSSERYVNRQVPVRAVFMLQQAADCEIEQLSLADAFRQVFPQTVVNSWNERFVDIACDLITDLIGAVPVYHFACTPDRRSVDIIKQLFA